MNVLTIEKSIKVLDNLSIDWQYTKYHNNVCKILRSYGLSKVGSGSYSVVFSSPDFKYVIKVIKHPGSGTYRTKYSKYHLSPRFISKNKCVAIQKKVIVLSDSLNVLYNNCKDVHSANVGIVNGKCVMIDLD